MTTRINKMGMIGVMAVVALLSLSAHTNAFARETESGNNQGQGMMQQQNDNSGEMMKSEASQLSVNPSGEFKATGAIVNSNSAGILNVKLFGINFNINAINAKIEGGVATTTVANIAVGDKLSISGSIDQGTGAISAKQIVDRTLEAQRTGDIRSRIADLLKLVKQLQEQLKQTGR